MKTICLMALVLLVGMSVTALAAEPEGDGAPWFGNGAGDGGLWTTGANWWRATAPTSTEDVGHDNGGGTLTVNSSMGAVYANYLYVGDWGPAPWGQAYFSMESGLLVLDEELMIGYRGWDGGSYIDDWTDPCNPVELTWENWGDGSATILGGQISVGTTLGIGSTFSPGGVGGVGELHIDGGAIRVMGSLVFGVIDSSIPGSPALSVDITDGKLLLNGEFTSLDPRVTAFGGDGDLVFEYEADLAGYTTVTGVPEPATIAMLGLGGLALIRRKRKRA